MGVVGGVLAFAFLAVILIPAVKLVIKLLGWILHAILFVFMWSGIIGVAALIIFGLMAGCTALLGSAF